MDRGDDQTGAQASSLHIGAGKLPALRLGIIMKYRRLFLWLLSLLFVACASDSAESALPTVLSAAQAVTVISVAVTATSSLPPTSTFAPSPTVGMVDEPPTMSPVPTNVITPTATITPTVPFIPTNTPIALPTTAVSPPSPPPPSQPNPAYTLSPSTLAASAVNIYETTITIPTYGYENGFEPTGAEDIIYPYPRLNFDAVSPASARSYQAIVLENGFVSVTILPELGGRIYSWVDKATGRHLLYENPVVKPTTWGYRGWWLAAGGIEWAFPVEEHGLNEWRPWSYTIGATDYGQSVTVSNVEDRTGMEVGATISLDSGHAYMTIQPWVKNNTAEAHLYQFWLNAMVTLGDNHVSDQTQFIVPAAEVIIHSTGDGGVPASGAAMGWPVHNGRDMSWYRNWTGYLGFFIPNVSHGFTGVYDHAADQGIVRAYSPGWPAGTKFFGPATLSPEYWTEDGSNYIELWSGATASFWSNDTLAPGDTFGWTERWYPVHGIGGFTHANRTAALKLTDSGGGAAIAVAVSGGVTGNITLFVGGQEAANWAVTIYPGQAFRADWTRPSGVSGELGLRLSYADGTVAAQTGVVP